MRSSGSHSRKNRRRRRRRFSLAPILLLILIVAVVVGVIFGIKKLKTLKENASEPAAEVESITEETTPEETLPPETTKAAVDLALEEAEALALQYDYEAALELLSAPEIAENQLVQEKAAKLTEQKDSLVSVDNTQIPHIFFHSLIADTSLAFDGDRKQDGYNQVMTTVNEFNKILEQMYERGYVLVSLHDICYEVDDTENGGQKMVYGDIKLPEGKKAFVMSQDDLCYYEYQAGDGLATRIVIGEDGRPTCEYRNPDGTTDIGAYDLVPLLDAFIDEHPDFSYKGAKAVLAFTGYNGILGYRTDECYDENSQYYDPDLEDAPNQHLEEDRKRAVEVLKALVADGYELSSHSWGHLDMSAISMERFTRDSDRWERNVNSLIKEATGAPCDIIIYPKGIDIGSWQGYSSDKINSDGSHPDGYERFCYLHNLGFRYFCNVDSTQYFVQKGNDYFRMGRKNMDGDRMWRDMTNPEKAKLTDFIDVASVFDEARPTPVPGY